MSGTPHADPLNTPTPHLRAAGWALAFVLLLGTLDWFVDGSIIAVNEPTLSSLATPNRSRGLAVLRAQLQDRLTPSRVALFGSSELAFDVANRVDRFYSSAPTGFNVVAIGSKAVTPLVQVLATQALAPQLSGRPIVVILSPFNPRVSGRREDWFAGNFSRLHAAVAFTSATIPQPLRRETAQHLVQYPFALTLDPVLKLAVHAASSGSLFSRITGALVAPIVWMDRLWLTWVDRNAGALDVIQHQARRGDSQHVAAPIDWARLEAAARAEYALVSRRSPYGFRDPIPPDTALTPAPPFDPIPDSLFVSRLGAWPALGELATLVRSARAAGAPVLVIAIPYSGAYMDASGVSPSARLAYYDRLQAEAQRLGVALVDNRAHDGDRAFLQDDAAHLSAVGWLVFNRSIDDFVRRHSQ